MAGPDFFTDRPPLMRVVIALRHAAHTLPNGADMCGCSMIATA
jgi:hypothetical protein